LPAVTMVPRRHGNQFPHHSAQESTLTSIWNLRDGEREMPGPARRGWTDVAELAGVQGARWAVRRRNLCGNIVDVLPVFWTNFPDRLMLTPSSRS
jgi:hypothetical protein